MALTFQAGNAIDLTQEKLMIYPLFHLVII